MYYQDRLYGEFEISEPVVLDLINCPSLQRLKNIDQAGYSKSYFSGKGHSRFEHSVGVFLILKKYQASPKEQIAGLIHDVSHSAFSHCIDYVLDSGSEKEHNHQDNIFRDFVRKSEIAEIIKRYGFDLDYILNDNNFPLKEKELPDLCADRIDYSLRAALIFDEINKDEVKYFLNNLQALNGNWVFKNFTAAEKYAKLFFKLNNIYFAGLRSATMFRTVGDCLKYALKENYISKKDLYADDKQIISKISNYLEDDKKLKLLFERMNNKIAFSNDPKNYDAEVFCKSRVVDPLFLDKNNLKRVSGKDPQWKEILEKESKPKCYFLKFKV